MDLTTAEKDLATAIRFDHEVCRLVKRVTSGSLERLTATTEDGDQGDQEEAAGLSVAVGRALGCFAAAGLLSRLGYGQGRTGCREVVEPNTISE